MSRKQSRTTIIVHDLQMDRDCGPIKMNRKRLATETIQVEQIHTIAMCFSRMLCRPISCKFTKVIPNVSLQSLWIIQSFAYYTVS